MPHYPLPAGTYLDIETAVWRALLSERVDRLQAALTSLHRDDDARKIQNKIDLEGVLAASIRRHEQALFTARVAVAAAELHQRDVIVLPEKDVQLLVAIRLGGDPL